MVLELLKECRKSGLGLVLRPKPATLHLFALAGCRVVADVGHERPGTMTTRARLAPAGRVIERRATAPLGD